MWGEVSELVAEAMCSETREARAVTSREQGNRDGRWATTRFGRADWGVEVLAT